MTLDQFITLFGFVITGIGGALVGGLFVMRKTEKEADSLEATADKIREDVNVSVWTRTQTELEKLRAELETTRRSIAPTIKELHEVKAELAAFKKENLSLRAELSTAIAEMEEMSGVQRRQQDEISKLKVENGILKENNRKLMVVIRAYQLYQNAINARNEDIIAHGLAPLPSPEIPIIELGTTEQSSP